MAKLKGPLMSLSATGQLAKTIVFADWKGIDYARQHVVPANPNSADQQTQRGYLTDAVAAWHDSAHQINSVDLDNLNRYAGIQSTAMSGFNIYVREWINTDKAGQPPVQLYGTSEGTPASGAMEISISSVDSTVAVDMIYGTSKTALTTQLSRDEGATAGTTHTFSLSGLTAGVVYYYKIRQTTSGASHSMGIGSFVAA